MIKSSWRLGLNECSDSFPLYSLTWKAPTINVSAQLFLVSEKSPPRFWVMHNQRVFYPADLRISVYQLFGTNFQAFWESWQLSCQNVRNLLETVEKRAGFDSNGPDSIQTGRIYGTNFQAFWIEIWVCRIKNTLNTGETIDVAPSCGLFRMMSGFSL